MTTFDLVDPIVETTHGKVRGKVRTTVYDDVFYCFDSIPYAKPPLGELRFKSPEAVEPWQGELDCTTIAQKSQQYNRYTDTIEGSEDCLYLNVYAKQLHSPQPLPVMVYLHGGGFNTGDATRLSWGPDYFMMKDVVFITIGARLGALGFLSLSDRELQVPGNAGLKDIILALKWIKSNAHNFNGDTNNITLFGHSSGSCATHLLMLTEQCKGLFHKAILMAGHHLNVSKVPNREFRLATHLGYKGAHNDKAILDFLRTMDAKKLVGFNLFTQEELDCGLMYAFGPSIEPYTTDDTVYIEEPLNLHSRAWSNSIPIMLGSTSFEGLIQYKLYTESPELYDVLREHREYLLPSVLKKVGDISLQQQLAGKVLDLHLGAKELSIENVFSVLDLKSYSTIFHPYHRLVCCRLKYSPANTFLYRFNFDSPTFNLYRIKHCGPEMRGVGHVDELSYIFYMPTSYKLERDSAEYTTIVRMVDIWTAFAASSDPNANCIKPTVWDPVQRGGPHKCLDISHDITFIDAPEWSKCLVWNSFFEEAGVHLY